MSEDKDKSGIKEYRMDWKNLQPMAKLLIEKLENLQRTYPGFDFHLKAQKEKDRFWAFVNIASGDPANSKSNVVLEYYAGRVFVGAGRLDGTPVFVRDRSHWHRVQTVIDILDHRLTGSTGRPDAFQFKFRTRSEPGPT